MAVHYAGRVGSSVGIDLELNISLLIILNSGDST